MASIAFLNAVAANRGVVTDEIRKRFGMLAEPVAVAEEAPGEMVALPHGWAETKNWMALLKIARGVKPDFEPDANDRVPSIRAFLEDYERRFLAQG